MDWGLKCWHFEIELELDLEQEVEERFKLGYPYHELWHLRTGNWEAGLDRVLTGRAEWAGNVMSRSRTAREQSIYLTRYANMANEGTAISHREA